MAEAGSVSWFPFTLSSFPVFLWKPFLTLPVSPGWSGTGQLYTAQRGMLLFSHSYEQRCLGMRRFLRVFHASLWRRTSGQALCSPILGDDSGLMERMCILESQSKMCLTPLTEKGSGAGGGRATHGLCGLGQWPYQALLLLGQCHSGAGWLLPFPLASLCSPAGVRRAAAGTGWDPLMLVQSPLTWGAFSLPCVTLKPNSAWGLVPFSSAHLGMDLLLKKPSIQPIVKNLISSCVLKEKAGGNGKIIMSCSLVCERRGSVLGALMRLLYF